MFSASTKPGAFKAFLALLAFTLAGLITGCGATSDSEENLGEVSQDLCTGVKLAGTPASPQAAGASVNLTASGVACAGGETPEYQFRWFKQGTSTSFTIRDWGTSPTAVWNTTGMASGTYEVIVYARAVGNTGFNSAAYLPGNYLIGNVCNVTTSFTTSPTSPQASGTPINLTAAATCTGGATPQFRFAYNAPGTSNFVDVGPYGAASQVWSTTGRPNGSYNLIVYVRAVGNTSTYESYKYATAFNLGSAGAVCSTGTTINASPSSPQPIGSMITLTGASTCSAPQFRFSYRLQGTSTWILTGLGAYSTGTQTWNTTGLASGTYSLMVEARNTGNVGQSESTAVIGAFAIGATCSSVALGANPATPASVGSQVTLTGNATCASGATAEYRYSYTYNGSPYTLLRTYGAAAYVWDTGTFASGNYGILVETRAVGSTGQPEAQLVIPYVLSPAYATQANAGGGSHHACARVSNGAARCWGANDYGQLGNGTVTASSSSPVTVTGLSNVTALATGYRHSCAVLTDNTVRCWGSNEFGQLGNNSQTDSSTAVAASGISNAVAITAGEYHSCALLSTGGVSCWGRNAQNQTGTTTAGQVLVPTSAAGVTSGATSVVAGGFHTCAIVGGALKCWGDNSVGQLGTGATPQFSAVATQVPGLTSGVTSVGSGDVHVCAAVSGGVQCWGDNTYGQLGNGSTSATPITSPVTVPGLSGVSDVASGFVFSCARLSNQTVRCWGRNAEGEVGDGTGVDRLVPTAVSGISTATAITAGAVNGCAILANNTTRCWGYGGFGGLGNGSSSNALSPVLVALP